MFVYFFMKNDGKLKMCCFIKNNSIFKRMCSSDCLLWTVGYLGGPLGDAPLEVNLFACKVCWLPEDGLWAVTFCSEGELDKQNDVRNKRNVEKSRGVGGVISAGWLFCVTGLSHPRFSAVPRRVTNNNLMTITKTPRDQESGNQQKKGSQIFRSAALLFWNPKYATGYEHVPVGSSDSHCPAVDFCWCFLLLIWITLFLSVSAGVVVS